tara:strand:- start:25398 stop:26444 length:1047 start_codon:yes stop_codon:yes gene_type:complete
MDSVSIEVAWLRNKRFDITFIVGVTLLALGSGALVVAEPSLFPLILLLDLWFLGYHHVISTFTRLCFDRQSIKQNHFFLFYLPIIILVSVVSLVTFIGIWTIPTLYLYWQWFHYTRQSYGVGQAYKRKSKQTWNENEWASKFAVYLLPLWGILYRSYQAPEKFLFMDIKVIPVSALVVDIVGIMAMVSICVWGLMRLNTWRKSKLPLAHTLYMFSHFTIFYVGYIYIEDITYGWLVINVWHNAQYILFVWLFNNNRFKSGIDSKSYFLSAISQTANMKYYFLACLGISTLLYFSIKSSISLIDTAILPLGLIVFQTINFHHYVVDGFIWKMRKKPLQKILAINESENH